MWIETALDDKISLVIGTVYRHPQPNYQNFVKVFQNKLLKLKSYNGGRFIALGDFNIDYNRYNSSNAVKTYADNITSLGCEQLISWPTRLSLKRQSILDHIYIDNSLKEKVITL